MFIDTVYNKLNKTDRRSKKMLKNIGISFIMKGLSIGITFLTIPMYLKYFVSRDTLGIWLTLLSIIGWIFTFDLGIGNGLRNHLTVAIANKNYSEAKKYISSAYIAISGLSILIGLVLFFIVGLLNWNKVLNISQDVISSGVLKNAIRILLVGTLIQFVVKIINSMLMALQRAAIPSILQLIVNILLITYLLVGNSNEISSKLLRIAVVYVSANLIPYVIATIILFRTGLKNCKPTIMDFNFKKSKQILKLGGVFFLLQIMAMIIFSTNNFLISWLIGPGEVVVYQAYSKVFGIISTTVLLALAPVWSAVTEAAAKKEYHWILKTQNRLLKGAFVILCVELIVFIFSKKIVAIWIGKEFSNTSWTIIALITVADIQIIWWNINAYIANGLEKLKLQTYLAGVGAIINIPLAILFSRLFNDLSVVVFSNIICVLPYCIFEILSIRKYLIKKIRFNTISV